jgi:hypothetical protein
VLAVVLAFFFGYAFTAVPILRSGLALGAAAGIALAADTISIAVMEIVDNAVILVVPGAMEAGLADPPSGPPWRSRSRSRSSPHIR